MKLPEPLVEGVLVRRYQRFLTDVRLADGSLVTAHTPNTGSMKQCAVPGHRVLLSRSSNPARKLAYTLELIEVAGHWVDTHTQRSNRVVEEALSGGLIAGLEGYQVRREVRLGASRMDFLLEKAQERAYLEVKNVTLCCRPGVACFPDAVTLRGQKHLQELRLAVEQGHRALIFFLVQRGEAHAFSPADQIDPVYGRLLREVCAAGVEVLAYRTQVTPTENRIAEKLFVIL
ncbi:DNA/RNA nuclease SfsA [Geoalkalibacter halelectricus]|uniref:Sugar fermentation stimulation protein homolog n=1 Tax=Geoalkalibacter halelectricus TaxID=2847045 RepID=A0ABY5ZI33_9BACT|nr:DNA/RNA nuclease SfsA [Geoalkalibacter halelectricus]MDO3378998.1 DNA/RNA nuclease SfsA [Geoalkalibacter halelectricus]UWZ78812.1 DNA/RNA nuclease SfsA [Geoalkalibacter halelectricus]